MNNDRLKFRVWADGTMYMPDTDSDTPFALNQHGSLIKSNDGQSYYWARIAHNERVVEQCTGLKDKSTNLIYANDLIKSPNNSNLLVVKQEENGLWQPYEYNSDGPLGNRELPLFDLVRLYGVEIVGNIHEQKEQQ